jgi:uncharacterized membrane protein
MCRTIQVMSRLQEAAGIDSRVSETGDKREVRLTPRRAFLPLAWIFGALYVLVTPPFQVPDEYMHFYRAYQVSTGRLIAYRGNNGVVGGDLPASLWEFGNRVAGNLVFAPETKADVGEIWAARSIRLDQSVLRFYSFGNVSWYSPMNYAPQAISVAAARMVGLGPMGIFYAARFGNLLSWSLIVFAALRLIPVLHWTLVLCAMTPMCLAQASSISADATVNAVCFLFVAVVVRSAMATGPVRWGELILVSIFGAAAGLVKTAYFPLTILFLLIPANRFASRRWYWMAFAIFIVACVCTLGVWSHFTFGAQSYSMEHVDPHRQLVYMVHHPMRMVQMELGMLAAVPFISSIIGQLGWHDIKLWLPCTLAYWGMLFWATWIAGDEVHRWTARQRVILAIAVCGCWVAVFSLIYLTFTVVGGSSINGLQGRYMVPATLPFFLIFLPARKREWPRSGVVITGFASLFSVYALAVLVHRFYL